MEIGMTLSVRVWESIGRVDCLKNKAFTKMMKQHSSCWRLVLYFEVPLLRLSCLRHVSVILYFKELCYSLRYSNTLFSAQLFHLLEIFDCGSFMMCSLSFLPFLRLEPFSSLRVQLSLRCPGIQLSRIIVYQVS